MHTTLGGGLKFLEGVPMSLSGGREVRMDPKSIVRVVSVVDTRQVEEIGDRFVRVPGTGEENECARCGRLHEIHAAVETADGQLHVVGVSCARGSSIEDTVRKAIGRVRTIGRQRAEVASLAARMAEAEASLEELKATRPTVEDTTVTVRYGRHAGDRRQAVRVGDVVEGYEPDRYQSATEGRELAIELAVDGWIRKRLKERGLDRPIYWIRLELQAAERRLHRSERALERLLGQED